MAKTEIEIPPEVMAQELIWEAEHCEEKKTRKALFRAAAYFMTYSECVEYFGPEQTERYWSE